MPTLPVFFVAAPVLIASGLFVLVVAAPFMLRGFLERFADWLGLLSF
jgi:flagellar biosynthetic protein FliR